MVNILTIVCIAVLLGFVTGFLISRILINHKTKYFRIRSFARGFSGGFIIALVCFSFMPKAFEKGMFYSTVLAMIFGMVCAAFVEYNILMAEKKDNKKIFEIEKLIHNLIAGAVSVMFLNCEVNCIIILALILHYVYRGTRCSEINIIKVFVYIIFILVGGFLGYKVTQTVFFGVSMGFVGSAVLYEVCGDALTEEVEKIAALAAVAGFVLGVILNNIIM